MSETLQDRVKEKMARVAELNAQKDAMNTIYEALLSLPDTVQRQRVIIATAILLDINLEHRP